MPKIKFLEDRTVQDTEGQTFKKGSVHDVSDSSARHWINRGVAIEVADQPKAAPEPKKSKVTKKAASK